MIDIVFNNSTKDKTLAPNFFKKIIQIAAKNMRLSSKMIELSINLVSEARIRYLNQKYREKNKVTDVLSFPLNQKNGVKIGIGGIIPLGDIFICLPIAKENAIKEGMSLDLELAFLTVHGFLHLLGYEHEKSEKGKKTMFKLQDKILKFIN